MMREQNRNQEEENRMRMGAVISPMVATMDDLNVMSNDALNFLYQQQGNANGLRRSQMPSGVPQFWGNQEELREMARVRYEERTSNSSHAREVNEMAAGGLRERAARNMYRRW